MIFSANSRHRHGAFPGKLSCRGVGGGRWFSDAQTADALIDLFLVQKAAYEITYEAANRPSWIGIPLQGLLGLAERLLQPVREDAHA